MNAIIKIGNLQYLKVLEELLLTKVEVREEKTSTVRLSFFNFVELVIQIFQDFVRNTKESSLPAFILSFFVNVILARWKNTRRLLTSIGTCLALSACGRSMLSVTRRRGFSSRFCRLRGAVRRAYGFF